MKLAIALLFGLLIGACASTFAGTYIHHFTIDQLEIQDDAGDVETTRFGPDGYGELTINGHHATVKVVPTPDKGEKNL